ncbi:MAG: sigma-70 family RNA polymerase sigma factor [Pirellulales bacterium]|nr:sigma-70 family RNA polymerase sigma factor [Pirellulales bacterium]
MSGKTRVTLIQRLRDGADALAWDEFFHRYWPLIHAYARHRGCSDHTAEEVVQDVMLRIFEHRDVFRYDPQRGRFRDWLGMVVRNKVAEYRRRPSERVRPRGGNSDDRPPEPPADDPAPEAAWEQAFESVLLMSLLDVVRRETSPEAYLAFELLTLHELSGFEVARITGLSRNAAYKARRRVLRRLQELGGSYADEGRLDQRVKQAVRLQPSAAVQRSVATRIEKTMRSR